VAGFYRLRLNQATARLNSRLEARLAERERIARELHDTLLQGFQGLTLHFQAALNHISGSELARTMMKKALGYADQVLLEGRERVRDLRSEATKPIDLVHELGSYGEELAKDQAAALKVTVAGSAQSIHPVVGDEIYRIAREALRNAFHHSNASSIDVEVTYDCASFCLRVRDNGCGIDQEILGVGRQGHWGLSGMRERAQNIGGQLSIWSKLGTGTEMVLRIPAKVAYASRRKESPRRRIKRDETE
jgi:signal transduction histidine kinase